MKQKNNETLTIKDIIEIINDIDLNVKMKLTFGICPIEMAHLLLKIQEEKNNGK